MSDAAASARVPRRGALQHGRGLWELLCAALLALLAGPSPAAQRLADNSLPVHMLVEHWLLLGSGALAAVAVQRLGAVSAALRAFGDWRALGAVLFLGLVAAWHVPALFGAAVGSQPVHATMHLSHMLAGFALVVALPAMGAFGRVLLLLGMQAVMGVLAIAMYTGAITYPGYPPAQTATAGVAMLVGMQVVLVAILVVAAWLRR